MGNFEMCALIIKYLSVFQTFHFLISNFTPVWPENVLGTISIFRNWVCLFLVQQHVYISNVLYSLEKNVLLSEMS